MDKQRIGAFAEAVYRDMAGAMAIGMGYIGQRTGLLAGLNGVTLDDIHKGDWNDGHIIAAGRHLQFFINGKLASEFTDNIEQGRLERGLIGLQLHDKGMIVQFKEVFLKQL